MSEKSLSQVLAEARALNEKLLTQILKNLSEAGIYVDPVWLLQNLAIIDCRPSYSIKCRIVLKSGITIDIDKYLHVKAYLLTG